MNEEYSGEEEASYYSNDGSSYSRSASYEQSDEYPDDGSLSDGGSREELADREPPRGQLLRRPEGKARDSPPKPKVNVMDRIKPIKSTEARDPPQRPAIVPHKPVSTLAAPPPPPRVEVAKERIRKAPLEIPLVPSLSARRSEREQEGTPHNKEVNSKLLAKVDRFGDNELMTRKYRLFLQKRKKKCAGAPRDLMTLINKLETLDLTNTSCFAMCSQEEIGKRQFQGDIDLLERTDSATEKKMRPDYAIKKFTRSSADQHLDKPELLRPPFILSKTLEHIMTRLLDDDAKDVSQFPPPNDGRPRAEYLDIYLFVGDRLRSVKQDIQILSSHCPEIFTSKLVIQIYEQIVRFYILSCNELLDRDGFDPKINLEQLSSAFTSLMQCYKLSRQSLAAFYLKYNG